MNYNIDNENIQNLTNNDYNNYQQLIIADQLNIEDITSFKLEKEKFEKEKASFLNIKFQTDKKLREERNQLINERKKLESEIMEFNIEKLEFNKEKAYFYEEKKKLEIEKLNFKKIQNEFYLKLKNNNLIMNQSEDLNNNSTEYSINENIVADDQNQTKAINNNYTEYYINENIMAENKNQTKAINNNYTEYNINENIVAEDQNQTKAINNYYTEYNINENIVAEDQNQTKAINNNYLPEKKIGINTINKEIFYTNTNHYPKGLKNFGFNCYMNSLLQSFFYIQEFRNYFIKEMNNFSEKEQPVCHALSEVFYGLELKNDCKNYYEPIKFQKIMGYKNILFSDFRAANTKDLSNISLVKFLL